MYDGDFVTTVECVIHWIANHMGSWELINKTERREGTGGVLIGDSTPGQYILHTVMCPHETGTATTDNIYTIINIATVSTGEGIKSIQANIYTLGLNFI